MVKNENVKIIDTSTAHRTNSGWIYGFPELAEENFEIIANAKRVAVPGCHASGFVALVSPLIKNGLISPETNIVCHSITGYSGGGKKMIAEYEDASRSNLLDAPREYGLTQTHKHLREMKAISGLTVEPIFCPIVSDYYSGMVVTVPLFKSDLLNNKAVEDIKSVYRDLYHGNIVSFNEEIGESGFISANGILGKDNMQIFVEGNDDRILLVARFDNLGKGASGAAIECMNIMLGCEPILGLDL